MVINKQVMQLRRDMIDEVGIRSYIYDIKAGTLSRVDYEGFVEEVLQTNVPQGLVERPVYYPLDKKKVLDFFNRIKAGEESGTIEVRWHATEADEYEWYRYSFRTIFEEGKPISAVIMTENIQNQKVLQEKNEYLYGNLLKDEGALEGVLLRLLAVKSFYIVIFIDGNTGRGMEYLEHPGDTYRYFEPIENIDVNSEKYLRKYCVSEQVESVIERSRLPYVMEQLKNNGEYAFYFEGKNVKGENRFFKCDCFFVNQNLNQICFAFSDVTEAVLRNRDQKEAVEIALNTAEVAKKAKDAFLSKISHQIRTPLNAIVGMAELAKIGNFSGDKLTESMDIVLSSSQTLVNMVDDMLDASQASDGNIVIKPKQWDMNVLLEDLKKEYISLYLRNGQEYIEDIQIKHNQVYCDGNRLLRVLLNVLGNSSKFTPIGGTITLKVWEERVDDKHSNYHFRVTDTGKGIKPEDIEHVFEPFFRDRESEENYLEGNGLGLAVVKEIIDAKGANITVESEWGKGTSVEIIDKIELMEVRENKNESQDAFLAGRTVLLAEDQPINLLVARRMLERYGATVHTAENGQIARDKFVSESAYTYDMIFMDIQMPVMNGYEASEEIRKSGKPDAESVIIVSMTADVLPGDIQKALDAGMNAHLGKPIRAEDLAFLIKELLNI